MADRSEDWFNQSRRDLDSARAQRDAGFHEWACFIAQQSSEKALKAVFQRFGGEVRGHSLVELFNALQERVEIPGQLRRSAVHLDRHFILSRYPSGWYSGSPCDYFAEEDADGAICHSQKIVRFCHGVLAGPEAEDRPADSVPAEAITPAADTTWFPGSRRPEYAFRFYRQPPSGYVRASDKVLLADLARSDIQPGLGEEEFNSAIRSLLAAIPIANVILISEDDMTLTREDAQSYLKRVAGGEFSEDDLWRAFVKWIAFFFSESVIEQEISEIALRRAQSAFDR